MLIVFQLTLPEEVADALRAIYSEGVVVLEYGSGGSTFLALEANKKIQSIRLRQILSGYLGCLRKLLCVN